MMDILVAPVEDDNPVHPNRCIDGSQMANVVVAVLPSRTTRHLKLRIGPVVLSRLLPYDGFPVVTLPVGVNKQWEIYGSTLTTFLKEKVFASMAWT